jgi:hypothetical protein
MYYPLTSSISNGLLALYGSDECIINNNNNNNKYPYPFGFCNPVRIYGKKINDDDDEEYFYVNTE